MLPLIHLLICYWPPHVDIAALSSYTSSIYCSYTKHVDREHVTMQGDFATHTSDQVLVSNYTTFLMAGISMAILLSDIFASSEKNTPAMCFRFASRCHKS